MNANPTRVTRRTARTVVESAGCAFLGFTRVDGLMHVMFTGSVAETNAAFPLLPTGAGWRRDDPNDRSLRGAPGKWYAPLECKAAFTSRKIRKAARREFEGKGWSEARILATLELF